MRKATTMMALGLALSMGSAATMLAQSPAPHAGQQDERGPGARGRRGGPERALLEGITLSDAQKSQLQAMRKSERETTKGSRDQFEKTMADARAARQRGDTAEARRLMEPVREQMTRQRDERIAAIRSVLTADQRTKFDANVTAWKQHAAEREKDGKGGWRHGDRDGAR